MLLYISQVVVYPCKFNKLSNYDGFKTSPMAQLAPRWG